MCDNCYIIYRHLLTIRIVHCVAQKFTETGVTSFVEDAQI